MYLTQGLHRSLQQTPDAPATVCGDRTRTFRELASRVARLAGALRSLGVHDGERVGILSLNADRFAEALLAVPWANGVVNPVNIRWKPAEIIYSLADCQTDILLVDDTSAPQVPALREGYGGLRTVVHMADGAPPDDMIGYEMLIAQTQPVEDARRGGEALAGIFYTGGTTGFPKGVMLSHANLITSTLGSLATVPIVAPDGHSLHAAPMFHVAGLYGWIARMLLGGTHVFTPAFDPVAVLKAIARHRITTIVLVPTMIQLVADHPACSQYDLSSVRHIFYGGSAINEAVLARAMRAFPNAAFTQAYGMTELAPIATILGPDEHRSGWKLRSGGRAAAHCEVRIVDGMGTEVPRGTVGEVAARGANVTPGYWNKPDETKQALRDGWLHTGDGGYMDGEGYVHIVDRLKDMIVSGGENVYSVEVENAVASHPAVAACAIIGVPDAKWGECVHAVIVRRNGGAVTTEEIRDHCKALIADYKAPRSCDFVDTLPMSAAGKVLKRELRKPYWKTHARNIG